MAEGWGKKKKDAQKFGGIENNSYICTIESRESGFSFFFYSKEHEPLHIHVEGNGGAAKFIWNGAEFELYEKQGIKANDYKKIKKVIDENADIIISRWKEYFEK